MHFAATIERAEKQILLARHGRRLVNLLDDTPIVPGDARPGFEHADQARQILNDAEEDLREWQPNLEPIHSSATGMGSNLMPGEGSTTAPSVMSEEPTMPQHEDVEQSRHTLGEGQHFGQAQLEEPPTGEVVEGPYTGHSSYSHSEVA